MFRPRPPRLLVVDDELAVRNLFVPVLGAAGYDVVVVADGQAGPNAALAAGVSYDLVITNSYVPTMAGEQLIGHLRRLFPDPPILHLDDVKPFGVRALLEALPLAIEERPLPRDLARGQTLTPPMQPVRAAPQ